MVSVIVFTSIIKHVSGEFLIHLLVCQAFILNCVLTCEEMLEDSARAGKERLCDFYHRMVREKKGSPVSRRNFCFIHIAAEKLTGTGRGAYGCDCFLGFFFL